MARACKFCEGPIPGIRGKRAVFCSSVCREKAELSQQPRAVTRRQKEAIKRAEQRADESLKTYIDEQTTLLRIGLEERVRTSVPSKNQPRQLMLLRPDLEKQ
jgi:hypothetical protein